MKLLKRLLIGILLLLVVLAAVVVVAANLIDLNDYKDKIQEMAKEKTGRDLTIDGEMSVSYFPWVGLTLGKLSMANAEGFGDEAFASIDSADVKVEVMPLLRRAVNVKTVTLNGLKLDLQRSADGTANWEDLAGASTSADETTTQETSTTDTAAGESPIKSLNVGGIELLNANVTWLDAQAGTDAKLQSFNLITGEVAPGQPFDLTTDFALASNSSGISADVDGSATLTLDLDNQRYTIADLKLNTAAKGESLPNGALDAALGSTIVADLGAETVDIKALTLAALGINLSGDVSVTQTSSDPQVTASLQSDQVDVQLLMSKLGMELPVTADPAVLKTASFKMDLAATPTSAELGDLTFKLDDSTFKGTASLPNLAAEMPPVRFNLGVDAIDLDRYLPPAKAADGSTQTATETATASTSETATPSTKASRDAAGNVPIELPIEMLRKLDVDGVFTVGSVKVSNLTTADIAVPVLAKNGVVQLKDIKAALYQGNMAASMSVDVQSDSPAFSFAHQLSGVQAEPLLMDLLQDKAPVTGQADFQSQITTAGNTVNQMKANLNGSFSSDFTDGAVNGINLGYQLRRAFAVFKGQSMSEEPEVAQTDFSAMHVGATIVNGVLTSDDLDMRSPAMRVTGDGSVDFVKEYVDYTVNTKVASTAEGQGGKDLQEVAGLGLGIPIQGTFDELSGDFTGAITKALVANLKDQATGKAKELAKMEADKLKAEAKAKAQAIADDAKAKAEEKLEEVKNDAKAKLKEKLGADVSDEQVDKVKDKAKDALKSLFK